MRLQATSCAGALALQLFVFGCDAGHKAHSVPWAQKRTQVIDSDRKPIEVAPLDRDNNCVEYQGSCLSPRHEPCAHGADVVLDRAGQVLDFICYPGEATMTVEEIERQQGDIAQNQNDTVVLLDELDDGADIEGNVSIDANNVVIYGESPLTAVIAGNMTIDGNNALVRGVRIEGDLSIVKNNAVVALCVIDGDLEISANGAEIVGCDVFGDVRVTGNNVRFYGNRIAGTLTVSGHGTECLDNAAVSDADADRVVDDGELGAPLACD